MDTRELQLSGKARDYAWMLEQFNQGKLTIGGVPLNKVHFDKLRVFIKVANEIYENAWDLEVLLYGNNIEIKGLVIHFPEITIRNRSNRRHTIKDLFVKLPFSINGDTLKVNSPQGGRTTWTHAEWSSDYSHSHLSGINKSSGALPLYSGFCTGSGHINDYIADICSGEFSEELVTSLLVQIMGLASYESIEGTPYRTMSSIYDRSVSNGSFYMARDAYKTLYDLLMNHYKHYTKELPPIEFGVETGKYFVKDNDKFDEFLNSVPLTHEQKQRYLAFIDNTGTAWRYGASPTGTTVDTSLYTPYIFRSQEYSANIIYQRREETEVEYKVHPQIRNQIKKEIEYEINRKTIRKSTIDRYTNKASDARKSAKPSKVPVQANS